MGQFLQDPERSVFSAHFVRSALLLSRHRIIIDSRSLCWVKSCKRPMAMFAQNHFWFWFQNQHILICFGWNSPDFRWEKKTQVCSKHPPLLERKRPNIWNFSAVGRRKGNWPGSSLQKGLKTSTSILQLGFFCWCLCFLGTFEMKTYENYGKLENSAARMVVFLCGTTMKRQPAKIGLVFTINTLNWRQTCFEFQEAISAPCVALTYFDIIWALTQPSFWTTAAYYEAPRHRGARWPPTWNLFWLRSGQIHPLSTSTW